MIGYGSKGQEKNISRIAMNHKVECCTGYNVRAMQNWEHGITILVFSWKITIWPPHWKI